MIKIMKNKLAVWSWVLPIAWLLVLILVFGIVEELSLIEIPEKVLALLGLSGLVLGGLGGCCGVIALKKCRENWRFRLLIRKRKRNTIFNLLSVREFQVQPFCHRYGSLMFGGLGFNLWTFLCGKLW